MALAEVGESILVTFDLVVTIEGFENTVPTSDKEGLVINRLEAGIDEEGEQIYNYHLEFGETFDLVNSSGVVVQSLSSFWFDEASLAGEQDIIEPLPFTTSEINAALSANSQVLSSSANETQSILNTIPDGDIFKPNIANLNSIISKNRDKVASVRYNPADPQSVNNITSELEGSSLQADDAVNFVNFAEVLKTQQETVAEKSSELLQEEQQSVSNSNTAETNASTAVNSFIDSIPDLPGAQSLLLTAEDFDPLAWDTLEPETPSAASVLPEELSASQEAAQLFPLLDSDVVVTSGLV